MKRRDCPLLTQSGHSVAAQLDETFGTIVGNLSYTQRGPRHGAGSWGDGTSSRYSAARLLPGLLLHVPHSQHFLQTVLSTPVLRSALRGTYRPFSKGLAETGHI